MKLGAFEISLHNFGNFRLDGGAMFGSVPKNLWAQRIAPDSENCIALATNSLVIRHEARHILVDVGMGTKFSDKLARIYNAHFNPLANAAQITDVVLTHLHFDHAGGISSLDNGGLPCLTYPSAMHYLQRENLVQAQAPTLKDKASYFPDDLRSFLMSTHTVLDGEQEILPGIRVHPIHGHTPGQQWIELRSAGEVLAFPSDLIPTAHHLPLPFHMGYDLCAATLLREKESFLSRAVDENWIVVFQHDTETTAARIQRDAKGTFCIRERCAL